MMINRRNFLKSSGLAAAGFVAARPALAGQDHSILIVIFQRGAADGVSMVVPFGDKHYYSARPQIAIPEPKTGDSERAIDLDGFYALHPSLASLKPIYDAGRLAIIHAAGSPSRTRSHFDAQDYMESGAPDDKGVPDGWLNRYMRISGEASGGPFRAIAISSNVPRTLMGTAPALAMNRIEAFGLRDGRMEEVFATWYKETFDAVKMLRRANPQQYLPAKGVEYPRSRFGETLLQIAQLIKADIGLQVAFAEVGGWDTHANQGASRGQLANRLKDFGDGLSALHRDLAERMRSVVVVTMTEFGRTIKQNGSGGTDHGRASCLFVAGGAVKGGKVYGRWPGLAPDQLFEGRDLDVTTDFREVLSEILSRHMGARDVSPVFPRFRPGATLKLI